MIYVIFVVCIILSFISGIYSGITYTCNRLHKESEELKKELDKIVDYLKELK